MTRTPKRPRDPNQLAKMVVDLATSTLDEPERKNVDAQVSGALGGAIRARNLTPQQRKAIAEKAAKTRWKKDRPARETTG